MDESVAIAAQQSYLSWFIGSLGWFYTLALPATGFLAFVVALLLVLRGRGAMTGAALWFVVLFPVGLGIYGALEGAVQAFSVISMSEVTPKPSEIASGVAMSLVAPMVGMLVSLPAYLVAGLGSVIRSLFGDKQA